MSILNISTEITNKSNNLIKTDVKHTRKIFYKIKSILILLWFGLVPNYLHNINAENRKLNGTEVNYLEPG